MLKDATTHAHHFGLEEGLAYERCLFHLTFALDDWREGVAAFVEKRPPGYRDR
jgi:enoyl-CoA hydratase